MIRDIEPGIELVTLVVTKDESIALQFMMTCYLDDLEARVNKLEKKTGLVQTTVRGTIDKGNALLKIVTDQSNR